MKTIILIFIPLLCIFFACNDKTNEEHVNKTSTVNKNDSLIKISEEEEKNVSIKTDTFQHIDFIKKAYAKGTIKVMPKDNYVVTPPIQGFVKKIYHNAGDYVHKGAPLAEISHTDYLDIQEEYIKTLAQSDFEKQNYSRKGELFLESAGSLTKMEKSKSQHKQTEARLKMLEHKLDLLNIDKEEVAKGNLYSTITLYAPREGIISEVIQSTGQIANAENPVCKITNHHNLMIELNVPGKYIDDIQKNQYVKYTTQNDKENGAKITQILKEIEPKNNTFKVSAKPLQANESLYPGMSTEATILIDTVQVQAIDTSVIVLHNKRPYLFTREKQGYKIQHIMTEDTCEGFIILKHSNKLKNKKIVTKGTKFLLNKYIN
ncbi:MAG: efflux RND transporter periplasmic adaptor subunit [Bacteroidales bacterium]